MQATISLPSSTPISLRFLRGVWSHDLAMDLGTANTLVYAKGRGIVLNEPSVVAVDEESGKAVAVGHAAKEMFGKTSRSIRCVRPIKDGVISNFEMTCIMINFMLSQVNRAWAIRKPRLVVGVPSGITQVEKRAVIDAALSAGVTSVLLTEEPMAAAVGAGLPVDKPVANMIVDIGGGTTEVAVISMNGTLYSHSIRVAGDEMDEAIQRHVKRRHRLQIGVFEAERVKLLVGSVLPLGKPRRMEVFGRDLAAGVPGRVELTDEEVREALSDPVAAIISSVITALEQTSPEVAQDIASRGIHLSGGGSLLKGLAERLHVETGIRFFRAQEPLTCVVRGVGKIVDNLKEMKALCIS